MKKTIQRFDFNVTAWVQKIPLWAQTPMVAASFIGLPGVVIIIAILITLLSLGLGQTKIALALVMAIIALASLAILKRLLRRARPDTPYVQKYQLLDYSFPSGHSSGSLLVYGLLAYLALTYLGTPWSFMAATILILTAFAVGVSRVYLGAHYPTDVLGAWILSALYLTLIIVLTEV